MHLETDEEQQKKLEQQLSENIRNNHSRNATAFAKHIPSLLADVQNVTTQNIAIFANKNAEYNIVDYGAGRTVYGLNPKAEVFNQFKIITRHMPFISLQLQSSRHLENEKRLGSELTQLSSFKKHIGFDPLPNEINVLVVFGLGLGYHILELVEQYQIKHLVIYEPERQYFQCSILANNWQTILQTMESKGTAVYFQLEKDGRDLVNNIEELSSHFPVDGFYFYKHYNHPVFDAIDYALKHKTWAQIKSDGFNYSIANNPNLYLPIWSESIDIEHFQSTSTQSAKFQNNLKAFEKYFPDIYKEFKQYQPQDWLPVFGENGEINLIQKSSLISFNGESPKQDASINYEHFKNYPNKDGLVLGYTGTKLKKYLHYQFVAETEKLLKDVDEEAGQLPDTVKSLIMFGIGPGYQLETLFEQKNVEKLFLCEPNRDFFYASLFAIDWQSILTKADQNDFRIYINIGDDGSNLFRDLLSQFYSIGPYILASTYFYQGYYNANLVQAIAQLREQLQIVISMGEYYDHARYGIAHTTETIARGYPLLEKNPQQRLTWKHKEVPVFIVGNGPSLDYAIEEIKTWQGQAIVVSCGTALMPLYKNGIVPDFHAEIEQNRSTFDWICRVGDFDYLKQISLISCNGIHPDTCNLFKDVYVAFKEGESSTISALNILGRQNYEELKFAFPTVSNFTLNIFSKIGFNQLYLFGVDLGFADREKHHSKQSGYYNEDGKEAYDYREKNNTSIIVPGNLRKTVFTKHEFKVSKEILEQTLRTRKVDCFNTSDGARIAGTTPLAIDNILLVNSPNDKQAALEVVKTSVFKPAHEFKQYSENFNAKYQQKHLEFELNGLIELVKQPINSAADLELLINKQKDMLFASYSHGKSLLFYLLYGTMNYANSVLSKLINQVNIELESLNTARVYWLDFLTTCIEQSNITLSDYDITSSMANHRERLFLSKLESGNWRIRHSFGPEFGEAIKVIKTSLVLTDIREFKNSSEHYLCDIDGNYAEGNFKLAYCSNFEVVKSKKYSEDKTLIIYPEVIKDSKTVDRFFAGEYPFIDYNRLGFYALRSFTVTQLFEFIIPKLAFLETKDFRQEAFLRQWVNSLPRFEQYIDFPNFIAVPRKNVEIKDCLADNMGGRGRLCKKASLMKDIVLTLYSRNMKANFIQRFKTIVD